MFKVAFESLAHAWLRGAARTRARRSTSAITLLKSDREMAAQQLRRMGRFGQSLVSMSGAR